MNCCAIGQTKEMLLISMSAMMQARINILHHMSESDKEECSELQFWPDNKTFAETCKDVSMRDRLVTIMKNSIRNN